MRQNKPSFNPADTLALVGAVAFGKGLSKCRPPGPGAPGQGPMMGGGPTLQQVTIGGASGQPGIVVVTFIILNCFHISLLFLLRKYDHSCTNKQNISDME